jgi:hypothetical protein
MRVSTQHDNSIVVTVTYSQLVECAVSQCVWRDEHGKFLGRATVAERVCEHGGACSVSASRATCAWYCYCYLEDTHRSLRAMPAVSISDSS